MLPLLLLSDALVEFDQGLFLDIWNADGRGSESICRTLTELGSVYFWGPVTLLLWLLGQRRLALYLLVAMTLFFFLGAGMKLVIDRPRPFEELLIDTAYHPLGSSFPSGHTMGISTAATTIALRHRWAALPMAGVAVLVGASRILLGVHYPLDVIAAAVIGVLLALWVGSIDLSPVERRLSFAYDRALWRAVGRLRR